MDWKEEMKMGMLMIQSACQKNPEWGKCYKCPFNDYCDAIYEVFERYPDELDFESEEN